MSERTKKSQELKRYKTKKLLNFLRDKKGFHTELISLYIPHDRKLSDVTNYLKNEIAESQNIKSKLTRKNVLDSISSLQGQLKNFKEVPDNGLIMFSGAIPQGNAPGTEKNETYILDPPEKVTTFKYHCSSEFLLEPLELMLEEREIYGLIVVDRGEAAVGYLQGSYITILKDFTSGTHSKHRAGGQSSVRFSRLIEEGKVKFIRRIAEYCNEVFLNMEELKGIFVGGPGFTKNEFVKDGSLDYRLQEKIINTVDIGYGGKEGIRPLVFKIKDDIKNVKYIREKEIVQNFLGELARETGLAVYGEEEVRKSLNYGALDYLILSEDLNLIIIKIECESCQYSETKIINAEEFENLNQNFPISSCPRCQSSLYNIVETKTLIEDLGELAETSGTNVEIISSDTEDGEMILHTFGGIAGILRYKIDY
jgi:peptide chain release factor subunit 1